MIQIDLTDICKTEGKEITVPVACPVKDIETREACIIKELVPFDLTVTNVAGKRIAVKGRTSAVVVMNCDRCLKEVERTLNLKLEREFPLQDEVVVPDEDDPVSGVTDQMLYPHELLQDELFLNLPTKVLCREDCKGLCPVCGCDLNQGDCGCEKSTGSLQMAKALENIIFDQ